MGKRTIITKILQTDDKGQNSCNQFCINNFKLSKEKQICSIMVCLDSSPLVIQFSLKHHSFEYILHRLNSPLHYPNNNKINRLQASSHEWCDICINKRCLKKKSQNFYSRKKKNHIISQKPKFMSSLPGMKRGMEYHPSSNYLHISGDSIRLGAIGFMGLGWEPIPYVCARLYPWSKGPHTISTHPMNILHSP